MSTVERLSMSPRGWFQIGWSSDLEPGQVRPLKYFGQELVAYRSAAGRAVVMDAHCPHLGAHLGHGGRVVGEGLECPFHGWQWAPDGTNVCIPYQERVNTARRLRAWSTVECNGILYLWHDETGGGPDCAVPDMFGLFEGSGGVEEYHAPGPAGVLHRRDINMHPQFVVENGVDFAHFKFVHRAESMPTVVDRQFDDWSFRTTMSLRFSVDGPDRQEPESVEGGVRACILGVGLSYAHAWGIGDVCSLTAATPVDDERSELFFTAWVGIGDGETEGMVERRQRSAVKQVLADLNIWEHQKYTEPPVLASAEADGFRSMRRWARRFYPPTTAPQVPVGGDIEGEGHEH